MVSESRVDRRDFVLAGLYVVFASVAALQSIGAHSRHPLILDGVFALMIAGVVSLLLFVPLPRPILRGLSTLWPWLIVLVVMGVADVHLYTRTITSPDPLTTGLALSEPGRALLHGHDPYAVRLPHDAPISPGPGWILLMLPFAAGSSLGLLNAVVLGLLAVLVWQHSRFGAVVLVLLCLAEPMFIAEASHGQDLFVISLSLAILCLLLTTVRLSRLNVALIGLLGGFVATSRVPIILFVLLIGLGLWKLNRAAGALFAAVSLAVCSLLHLGFAVWSWHNGHRYPPLHIAGRATGQGGIVPTVIAALLLVAAAVWVARWVDGTPERWLLGCWLLMTLLFAPNGLKELVNTHFNWAWEGDNYISFPLPLLITAIALRVRSRRSGCGQNNACLTHEGRFEPASYS